MHAAAGLLALFIMGTPLLKSGLDQACPVSFPTGEVCVFTQGTQVIAINPTNFAVRVSVQVQRIENIELRYRYPFIEELPAHSKKNLIEFEITRPQEPFALEYEWHWGKAAH